MNTSPGRWRPRKAGVSRLRAGGAAPETLGRGERGGRGELTGAGLGWA